MANIRIVELICDLMDELAPHLGGNSRRLITFVKDRPGHDRRYAIDAGKIQKELGWKPAHTFQDRHPRDRFNGIWTTRIGSQAC